MFTILMIESLQIYICGWWVCPELYLRRPFHAHASSKLDALLEAKAKRGVQVLRLLYNKLLFSILGKHHWLFINYMVDQVISY